MKTSKLMASLAALVGLFTATGAARAESLPISKRSAVGGDIYWLSARGLGSTFALVPFFDYEVAENVYLDFEFPFTNRFDSDVTAGLGNPAIGAHYAETNNDLTWYAGGRGVVPIGSVNDNTWRRTNALAAASMAYYDLYLWAGDFLPLVGNFGLEYNPIEPLYLRGSLDPMVWIPTGRGREFTVTVQGRFEVEAKSEAGIGGGFGLQGVGWPGSRGPFLAQRDFAQMAAEPYFAFDNNRFFMRAGLLIALNTPLGFGFDQGRVASVHVNLGGHL